MKNLKYSEKIDLKIIIIIIIIIVGSMCNLKIIEIQYRHRLYVGMHITLRLHKSVFVCVYINYNLTLFGFYRNIHIAI